MATDDFTVECRFWRATYDNVWLEDITDAFLSATVAADAARDTTWSLDATLSLPGWQALEPYLDWVAPVLTVRYPDGTVRRGQLGLYLVMDSAERRGELSGTVRLDGRDPLYLLSVQGFATKLVVRAGTDRIRTVRAVLDGALLTEDARGRPRFSIPNENKEFKRPREWSKGSSRLQVCNEILEGCGFYPLWATAEGVVTTRRRGVGRLRHREPVRTFSANVPGHVELERRARPVGGVGGEVVSWVDTTPGSADQVNEILVIGSDPSGRRIGLHTIEHPDNPRSDAFAGDRRRNEDRDRFQRERTQARREYQREKLRDQREYEQRIHHLRRWTKHHPLLDDDATAKQVAAALADELSTHNSTLRVQVLPDPKPDYLRETVGLAIWTVLGERVAKGVYAIFRVQYGLTATSATMTLDVGRIDSADGIISGGGS